MKQFLTVMQGKRFIISSLLTLTIIWFLGPYLAIADKTPFATINQRVIASAISLIIFFIIEYRNNRSFSHDIFLPDEIKHELNLLQNTLLNVLKTLHRSVIKSFLFRYKKPWYLVLGPTNAGKSTLLNKADLNITGVDNLPPMTITPTKFFNWWLSSEAVFIDIGGRYLKETKENQISHEQLFQGFFKLLKRYRYFKPINGLILTVNLQELTVNTKDQSQLKKLKQLINELILKFVDFPIYLLITRCDVIEGFVEFFEDLGPEERNQVFGISFPLATKAQSLPQLFNEEYNALLTRLNEKILSRIQQENNVDKISKIKNFPLQMEFLKSPLAKLLNVILPNTQVNLRGVFFVSASQKDTPFDNLTKTLSHAYDVHHIHHAYRATAPKSFFISDIFKRIIIPESKFYASHKPESRNNSFTSLGIIVLTIACLFCFYNSYKINLQAINETQQAIHYLKQQHTNEDRLIQHLDLLNTIRNQITKSQGAWYNRIGLQQADKLKNQAEKIYLQLLTTQFLNYLQRTIEIQLQNTQENNTKQLYATLKVYLMLGDHQHLDKNFLKIWFNSYWQQIGITNKTQLPNHLDTLLQHSFKETPLNSQLIANKRLHLNSMPQSRLVLTILQNQYQRSPIKLLPPNQASIFSGLPTEIAGIFNITNFSDVYYKEIIKTCQEITHGDWVLGLKPQPAFSEITLNQLATEVQAIYLNEYALIWSDILSKVKLNEFENLHQIVTMLDLLNNPQSPLIYLINTIRNNTQPISNSIEFTQQVSSRFLWLNSLSTDILKSANHITTDAMRAYLYKVIQAPDIDKAGFEAAKVRMETINTADVITTLLQQSQLLPEPLKTWHTTIAAESWRLLLQHTQNYLNRIWTASVYPQYSALLDKRYPLFKESSVDISLNDFANFFGNNGTMDTFFKTYLQPFVDNSRLYWEWKNVDGQRLNISQSNLEMFIRAALIQKMFFPDDAKIPAINFSLVPVELDPNIQSFTLDLEGQLVTFQKDNEQIITLTWPGPQQGYSEISFMDSQAKKIVIREEGPWSWFKILDKSRLESTSSPKHFKLSFILNSSAVHYELYTNGIVNPFLPGIVSAFRCPENL